MSLVSASRLTTVERLIFICDLVNSKTSAEEARRSVYEGPCTLKENSHAVTFRHTTLRRLLEETLFIYHLILIQQPVCNQLNLCNESEIS